MLHPLPVTKQMKYVQVVQFYIPSSIKWCDKLIKLMSKNTKWIGVLHPLVGVRVVNWNHKKLQSSGKNIMKQQKIKWTGSVTPSENGGCLKKKLFARKIMSVFDPLYQNWNHKHITTNINSEYSMIYNWILNVKKIVNKIVQLF